MSLRSTLSELAEDRNHGLLKYTLLREIEITKSIYQMTLTKDYYENMFRRFKHEVIGTPVLYIYGKNGEKPYIGFTNDLSERHKKIKDSNYDNIILFFGEKWYSSQVKFIEGELLGMFPGFIRMEEHLKNIQRSRMKEFIYLPLKQDANKIYFIILYILAKKSIKKETFYKILLDIKESNLEKFIHDIEEKMKLEPIEKWIEKEEKNRNERKKGKYKLLYYLGIAPEERDLINFIRAELEKKESRKNFIDKEFDEIGKKLKIEVIPAMQKKLSFFK